MNSNEIFVFNEEAEIIAQFDETDCGEILRMTCERNYVFITGRDPESAIETVYIYEEREDGPELMFSVEQQEEDHVVDVSGAFPFVVVCKEHSFDIYETRSGEDDPAQMKVVKGTTKVGEFAQACINQEHVLAIAINTARDTVQITKIPIQELMEDMSNLTEEEKWTKQDLDEISVFIRKDKKLGEHKNLILLDLTLREMIIASWH